MQAILNIKTDRDLKMESWHNISLEENKKTQKKHRSSD